MSDKIEGELLEELCRIYEAVQGSGKYGGSVPCDSNQERLMRKLISLRRVEGRPSRQFTDGSRVFNQVRILPRGLKELPL